MNLMMLSIVDECGAIHRKVRVAFAEAVAAALSADPDTMEELRTAMGRFAQSPPREAFFEDWPNGACDEAPDGGLCLVDLPARLVVVQLPFEFPARVGRVAYLGRAGEPSLLIPYCLSDDWLISEDVERWSVLARERRERRRATPPLDARDVLYGKVIEFLVAECLRAAESKETDDPIAEIHARWLLTPRDDLQSRSPRDLLLADRERIDRDLEDRSQQWSRQGECPPGLDTGVAAYRYGGFGTHENVLYYQLLRRLLEACWDRVCRSPISEREEVARLKQLKHKWLHAPHEDDLAGHTPAQVIQRERARLPLAVSGKHAMVDDDCPLCQMMAEGSGPVFLHLDGCNMDDHFAFSTYETREEWEREQQCWREMEQELEMRRERARAPGPAGHGDSPVLPMDPGKIDFLPIRSDEEAPPEFSEASHVELGLFAIGGCLAELEQQLEKTPENRARIATLNRGFGNLRQAARDRSAALLQPVAQRLSEDLQSAFADRPDLADRCMQLESRLAEFAQRWSGEESEEEPPFESDSFRS